MLVYHESVIRIDSMLSPNDSLDTIPARLNIRDWAVRDYVNSHSWCIQSCLNARLFLGSRKQILSGHKDVPELYIKGASIAYQIAVANVWTVYENCCEIGLLQPHNHQNI